ncbi:MAG TPA: hypothetical protein VM791_14575 [Vicinamibacterales bacterium]|nr:hypothetical protein [Vicinamibacterales bacterium]
MTHLVAIVGICTVIATSLADVAAETRRQKPVIEQPQNQAQPQSAADAQAIAELNTRIKEYVAMHQRLEATLPPLPKETNPKVIDTHERALEKLIRTERKNARPGDIITPAARRALRQRFARVFSGTSGQQFKATILDENPGRIALTVNSRYPDEVPVSTVPPQVLSALPPLPDELEYRFIGERLILLDIHAHTIADFMDNAFPR